MNTQLNKPQYDRQDVFKRYLDEEKKQQATNSFIKSFFISFVAISLVVLVFYIPDAKNLVIDLMRHLQHKNTARFELKLPFSPQRQNILILATDVPANHKFDNFKGVRSDSISLVSIAPFAKDINIISIPRDSKVYFSNSNKPDKINHAFARGGIELTKNTIEETFGVRINHYIIISPLAFSTFIDEIGGLPIYIEKEMHYGDKTADLFIDLSKGHHVLNGKQAEGYMRFRNDHLGDIGRIGRQQWFFNALCEKVKQPQTLAKLPEAVKSSMEYVKTDLSFYQIAQLAGLIKMVEPSHVKSIVLPGSPSSKDSVSYWILDPVKTQKAINTMVYRDAPEKLDRPIDLGILYTANSRTLTDEIASSFDNENYKLKTIERSHLNRNQISIHNMDISKEMIDSIQKANPKLSNFSVAYDLVGFNRAGKDVTIILADENAKNAE